MTSKNCSNCKELKPLTDFYHRPGMSPLAKIACRKCNSIKNLKYTRTFNGLVNRMLAAQRYTSKKRNHVSPEYTVNELKAWVKKQPNFMFLYENWVKSEWDRYKRPSIDRLDDYKPYTFDNIRLVTWEENCNRGYSDKKNGVNNKQSKAIIQMDKLGNFIAHHYSFLNAARLIGIPISQIRNCCDRGVETAGGYCWMRAIN